MATYVIYVEDDKGDLLDVEYYDSHMCMVSMLEIQGIITMLEAGAGKAVGDTGRSITFGKSPCAVSDVEYPVFCNWCNHPMNGEAITKDIDDDPEEVNKLRAARAEVAAGKAEPL